MDITHKYESIIMKNHSLRTLCHISALRLDQQTEICTVQVLRTNFAGVYIPLVAQWFIIEL